MRMRLMEVAFDEKKESSWVGFFGGIIWIWIKCLKPIFLSRRTIVEKSERKAVFFCEIKFLANLCGSKAISGEKC